MGVPKWRPPPEEPPSSPPRKRPRIQFVTPITRRAGSRNLRRLDNARYSSSTNPITRRNIRTTNTSEQSGPSNELGSIRDNQYERELEAIYTPPQGNSEHRVSRGPNESPRSTLVRAASRESRESGEQDGNDSDAVESLDSTVSSTSSHYVWGESNSSIEPTVTPSSSTTISSFRPYQTTLRRHNAIRNLRRMLQPIRNSDSSIPTYHNRAWTSSVNLPQIAYSLSNVDLQDPGEEQRPQQNQRQQQQQQPQQEHQQQTDQYEDRQLSSALSEYAQSLTMQEVSAQVRAIDRMISNHTSDQASDSFFDQQLQPREGASSGLSTFTSRFSALLAERAGIGSSQRSASGRLQAIGTSPRMAWLARKEHSSGILPEASSNETGVSDDLKHEKLEETSGEQDEKEEEGEEDECSLRPITRSTSFSSSTSRRSQRQVHFTNPVSDTVGEENPSGSFFERLETNSRREPASILDQSSRVNDEAEAPASALIQTSAPEPGSGASTTTVMSGPTPFSLPSTVVREGEEEEHRFTPRAGTPPPGVAVMRNMSVPSYIALRGFEELLDVNPEDYDQEDDVDYEEDVEYGD